MTVRFAVKRISQGRESKDRQTTLANQRNAPLHLSYVTQAGKYRTTRFPPPARWRDIHIPRPSHSPWGRAHHVRMMNSSHRGLNAPHELTSSNVARRVPLPLRVAAEVKVEPIQPHRSSYKSPRGAAQSKAQNGARMTRNKRQIPRKMRQKGTEIDETMRAIRAEILASLLILKLVF